MMQKTELIERAGFVLRVAKIFLVRVRQNGQRRKSAAEYDGDDG